MADHSCQCPHCQQQLHGLDAVSDPLILQIRNRRLQALAPELLALLKQAEGIAVQGGSNTLPPGQTLHGNPAQLTQEARQVLAPPQAADEMGRLGPYRVLKLLGQGGMGMVFLAEDPKLQRTVALKVMLPAVAVNATAKERFLREARATAAIEHDHIVTIHQVDEDRGMPFLAMQLLKGMSLEDYLKKVKETKKPITLGQILKLGREVARGLAVAHERGLIHRDIKPANIWLDATAGGRVKILDFGLARPAAADSTITQSGMIVGTPAYMAPEQATGQQIDGRADLFSLGVVLYRLCSGRLPWKGETAMGTLMAVATEDPPTIQELNPRLPPKLAALVMQLLAKKPEARPASAKAVVAAIQTIEREQAALQVKVATPIESAPNQWQQLSQDDVTAPLVTQPSRQGRRRWPLVAALLLAVGGLALLTPILIRIKNQDGSETVVQVPTGATITVEKVGKVVAQVPDGAGQGVKRQGEIDLFQLIDPQKHALSGQWRFEERSLATPVKGAAQALQVPFAPPPEYEIELTLTPVEGSHNLFIGLVGGGRGFMLGLDGYAASSSGLSLLDGKKGNVNESTFHGTVFENGKPATVGVTVDRQGVSVRVDGKRIIDWKGDFGRLTLDHMWKGLDEKQLALGVYNSKFLVHKMVLRPLGAGQLVRAGEVDLLQHIDGVKNAPHWRFQGQVLLTPQHGSNNGIQVSYTPPAEYELEIEATRMNAQDTLILGLVGGGRPFHLVLDGYKGTTSRLAHLDGKTDENETTYRGSLFTNEKLFRVTIRVTRAGVTVHSDGKKIIDWQGDYRRLNADPRWTAPNPEQLALCTLVSAFQIQKFVLRPLGVTLTPVRTDAAWIKQVQALPAEKQVEAVVAKLKELNPGFDGKVEHRLQGKEVDYLRFATDAISDISPLRAVPKVRTLYLDGSGPGRGRLADLTALQGMSVMWLSLHHNPVTDWSPLRGLPLRQVSGSENLRNAADVLRSIASLETINNRPVKDVPWLQADVLEPWIREVRQLPPEKQVEAVAAKLKERNPGFDGQVDPAIEKGQVARLCFLTDRITDLSPVRAFPELQRLNIDASDRTSGRLATLEPLRGLPLRNLTLAGNPRCNNLEPLRGMPLQQLNCSHCGVRDLSPLQGMPLRDLRINETLIAELTPLRGLPLTRLDMWNTKVADLSPLAGMPLRYLDMQACPVADLSPLRGMGFEHLQGVKQPERHTEVLKSLWAMTKLNGQPALDFWKQHDPQHAAFLQWIEDTKKLPAEEQVKPVAAKLQELNPGYDGAAPTTIENGRVIGMSLSYTKVTDISPLRALAGLKRLSCSATSVSDLSPLRGLPLTELHVASAKVADLSPLSGMPLQVLTINGTRVSDLSPLRGMPLTRLVCNHSRVADLSPLRGLPLTYLNCDGTPIADFSPLQDLPLKELVCDKLRPERDATILRSIKTLEKINGRSPAEFWKEGDGKKP
ncbi:MAG: protein kinase [Planctomycetia bacterium]|nr:protein kinase [Planctomycetia bacterium]